MDTRAEPRYPRTMPKRAFADPEAAKFGDLIRKLREGRRLTLIQVGRAAKMNPTYLGFLENGRNVPTLTVILRLSRLFGVRASELIRQVEERNEAAG